jgi:hypothetical protein
MNEIEKITLNCMINNPMLKKNLIKKPILKANAKDIKFYRKRIMNLLKQYTSDELPEDIFLDVEKSIDYFVLNSIHYFQMIDKSELYQKDYLDLQEEETDNILENIKTYIPFQEEEIIIPYIKKEEVKTMDYYVRKNKIKEEITQFFPIEKKVNIKSKELKKKGICKKKNITNKYEDNKEEK